MVTIPKPIGKYQKIFLILDESFLDYVFNQESKAEYVVCTKTANSNKTNPVIGFALFYEPTSLIAILADANVVSLGILTIDAIPANPQLQHEVMEEGDSPLKKMLREPFDLQIQKILKRSSQQPILKLGGDGCHTQKECYEVSFGATDCKGFLVN